MLYVIAALLLLLFFAQGQASQVRAIEGALRLLLNVGALVVFIVIAVLGFAWLRETAHSGLDALNAATHPARNQTATTGDVDVSEATLARRGLIPGDASKHTAPRPATLEDYVKAGKSWQSLALGEATRQYFDRQGPTQYYTSTGDTKVVTKLLSYDDLLDGARACFDDIAIRDRWHTEQQNLEFQRNHSFQEIAEYCFRLAREEDDKVRAAP